ncbi:PREDICTED: uncharacterized protein LOC109220306 [Nicotiana attenuata]|uniref:uncharacterized protein LOC109220306 n=1 Tax=Nicotiana attenuata TaxID=49451 RepID=UPI000904B447|nr:PREDICTED: uncharacterized protein LOC109220306 [Nicotiana attenuata]
MDLDQVHQSPPPKPPDITTTKTLEQFILPTTTFKDKLIHGEQETSINMTIDANVYDSSNCVQAKKDEQLCLPNIQQIQLTQEDIHRIYEPWKFSTIIKLQGRRIQHHLLKKKLHELWKAKKNFPLIDLGCDYFITKFSNEETMKKALHMGPWFIYGHFLSVQRWEPNFLASDARISKTTVWKRLPQLPTEFYDSIILTKVGNKIGKLLKVDACTSSTLRGRYARLCIELPLDIPVPHSILIGSHKQTIYYEMEIFYVLNMEDLGMFNQNAPLIQSPIAPPQLP